MAAAAAAARSLGIVLHCSSATRASTDQQINHTIRLLRFFSSTTTTTSTEITPGSTPAATLGLQGPQAETSPEPPVVKTTAAASPASKASPSPTKAASRPSALPAWLRFLLPGGEHLRSSGPAPGPASAAPSPSAASPSTAAAGAVEASAPAPAPAPEAGAEGETSAASPAPASQESQQRKEYIQYLEQHKDLTIDGFVQLNKQILTSSEAPKPKLPPVPRTHPDYHRFIDWKRITYLRTSQHEKIINILTPDEKLHVKSQGRAVLQERRFIQDVADRTGMYIDHEVKDCIKGYLDTRDHMRRLYRWTVVLGKPEPMNQDNQRQALQEMKEIEEEEERIEKLEKQDPSSCPILPLLDFLGHDATCSRTGLRFHQCCGRAEGRPKGLEQRDRVQELEGMRGRKAPRSERALRRGMRDRGEALKWEKI